MDKIDRCRQAQIGRIVIHKGDKEKRIFPEDLSQWIDQGWQKGTSTKHRKNNSQQHQGSVPWNKGTKGVMHRNSTSFERGRTPWNKGQHGLQESWCRGLTKEDPKMQKRVKSLQKSWDAALPERRQAQSIRGKQNKGKHKSDLQLSSYLQKCYTTRQRNNTFNLSSDEIRFKKQLVEVYGERGVLTQYRKDSRYPFNCDFYIPSEDKFIELNLHWTHGGRPYDPNDSECQAQLAKWQEKAKISKFYQNAIETWTVRDVRKLEALRSSHLCFIIIYPSIEIKE